LRIAEKIRLLIERTRFVYKDEEIPVTISVGVTEAQSTDVDSDTVLVRADDAMYQAKRKGRNRVCVNCKTTDFGLAVTANDMA
jgi:diguanylate cyclase (GGDEF)-like protein